MPNNMDRSTADFQAKLLLEKFGMIVERRLVELRMTRTELASATHLDRHLIDAIIENRVPDLDLALMVDIVCALKLEMVAQLVRGTPTEEGTR